MIARISTEGQYELPDEKSDRFEELDDAAHDAVESGDEAAFDERFAELLEFIRSEGKPVDDDHLGASDVILPPPDTTLTEAAEEFSGEGLLPHEA